VGILERLIFWYPVVEHIRNHLPGWKSKNLSIGGRLILLKSVLSSILVYFLSFFNDPSSIVSSLGEGVKRLIKYLGSNEILCV
jgi:hypothetical protein